ncbi:MAG: CDP-alcohol phosphatidyltransferase family protein [Phycisphaerae bacterium]
MTWLNWPNRITVARIVLVAPLVICLLNLNAGWVHWRHLTLGLVVVMAASDGLDGFLARRLGEETLLGRYLDPVADKLLITCAVVLLAIEATAVPGFLLPSWVPVIAIGKDLLTLIGFALIYATTGAFFVEPRALGKACTLVQLGMILFCLLAPDLPAVLQRAWPPIYWLASGLAVVAVVDYIRVGNRFAAGRLAEAAESSPTTAREIKSAPADEIARDKVNDS